MVREEVIVEKWSQCGVLIQTRKATTEEVDKLRAVQRHFRRRVPILLTIALLGIAGVVFAISRLLSIDLTLDDGAFELLLVAGCAGAIAFAASLPYAVKEAFILLQVQKDKPGFLVEEYGVSEAVNAHAEWFQSVLGGPHLLMPSLGSVTVAAERSGLILNHTWTRPRFLTRVEVPLVCSFSPSGPVADDTLSVTFTDAEGKNPEERTMEVAIIPRLLVKQERELLKRIWFKEVRSLLVFGIYFGGISFYSVRIGTIAPAVVLIIMLLLFGRRLLATLQFVRAIGSTIKENVMAAVVTSASATERVNGKLTLSGRKIIFEQLAFGWPWRVGPLPFLANALEDYANEPNGKASRQ